MDNCGLILFLIVLMKTAFGRDCLPADFRYEYTQCDGNGERWRIALPKSHSLQCSNVPIPQSGVNCSFSCAAGLFLDMETQECRICPSGTYSLGDGVRYEEFQHLPDGFAVENFVDDAVPYLQPFGSQSVSCPKGSGWGVSDGEIRYSPTSCISRLSITLHLVHDGYIEIYYQMPKNARNGLLVDLVIRNEQCESYGSRGSSIFEKRRKPADEDIAVGNDWHLKRFSIRRGQNLLVWTVASNNELTTLADVIRVAKIDIVGLAFTPTCSQCPSGTFSGTGASQCVGCVSGTFSLRGSSVCQKCQLDEYSGPKARQCLPKPPCKLFDYFPTFGICSNKKISSNFQPIRPHFCQTNSPNSVQTPTNREENCQNCHPGTFRDSQSGLCDFCPKGKYSANGMECLQCPNRTIPQYGLFYTNWERMPKYLSANCEYLITEESAECSVDPVWIPMGNRIETSLTRARGVALELSLNISEGFFDPLRDPNVPPSLEDPIGYLAIDFENKCADDSCNFYIVAVAYNGDKTKRGDFEFLLALNGAQKRQRLSFPIDSAAPTRFILAFMRSGAATFNDVLSDQSIIYSLNITNIGHSNISDGGAAECRQCPLHSDSSSGCRPCPSGHYIQQTTNKCLKCPEGTALNTSSSRLGIQSCIQCPPNMGSESRTDCSFNGKFSLRDSVGKTQHFDLTPLKNSIATKLAAITQNRTFQNFHISDDQLEYDNSSKSPKPIDVHFFFEPNPKKIAACSNGTIGVVTVRCDPLIGSSEARLSHRCPDGTCDGCLFHVIVESSFGCPICDPTDFDEIRGECLDGYQKIHSIPSKHCVLTGAQTKQRTEMCSNVSSNIRLLFIMAVAVISGLIVIIVIIHQRHKTLEYRYMRIIEGKEPDDANSCGLESDEEDNEDINQTKVFFNRKSEKESCKVTVASKRTPKHSNERPLNVHENADFLSDSD